MLHYYIIQREILQFYSILFFLWDLKKTVQTWFPLQVDYESLSESDREGGEPLQPKKKKKKKKKKKNKNAGDSKTPGPSSAPLSEAAEDFDDEFHFAHNQEEWAVNWYIIFRSLHRSPAFLELLWTIWIYFFKKNIFQVRPRPLERPGKVHQEEGQDHAGTIRRTPQLGI